MLALAATTVAVGASLLAAGTTAIPGPLLMAAAFSISLAAFALLLRMRRGGRWAPWTVVLDTTTQQLTCLDRRSGEERWSIPANPDHLYLSRLKLRRHDASDPVMALVYGNEPHTPVEDTPPEPHHTVLGVGSQAPLYALAKKLQEELDRAAVASGAPERPAR
ncbi:MAG: hypothetical protein EA380_09870 [Phycisphaeraceae bacterium]|nr:MAG: hypothetical protein EA380_09870 [Phycisphaeraceae bacterium]